MNKAGANIRLEIIQKTALLGIARLLKGRCAKKMKVVRSIDFQTRNCMVQSVFSFEELFFYYFKLKYHMLKVMWNAIFAMISF